MTYEQYLESEWLIWQNYCDASGISAYPGPAPKVSKAQWVAAKENNQQHLLQGACY